MEVELETGSLLTQVSAEPKEMLSWSVNADGRKHFRINFSSLSIMQECQRKVQLSLVRRLRTNLESPATLFGSAIHKGLEVFYSAKRTERALPKRYAETMEMIGCGHWEADWEEHTVFRSAHAFAKKAEPLKQLPDDNKRSVHTGVWMLRHYFETYLDDAYVIARDEDGPIVERKFTHRIHEDSDLIVDLFGTIDAVMKNEASGKVLAADHKTSSRLYDFYQMINPNHQYTGYLWAAREVLGLDTDSFLVNALEVKPPPKTARGSKPNFARQVTTRGEDDFAELKDAILLEIMKFITNEKADTWPMSAPGPCSKYGGCTYLEVCSAPKSLRENVLKARYASPN